ncbi:AAA family ATPase [Nonomuraea rubra]|uniref:DNA-binding CsgD family transcriptional regulator/tetratricopeptide (TPR) repeat protein n=1 Tax=Nonomuraea rubra TaxID=46180 RepID=A0A7X0NRY5_9ACTN|nr:LuxR family transcriptional regulator [Nonomuraea rubra]MBB6548523.1 DNA-binding CsgD family transcriptional regulator/tetratricopeptide (TPR) repeat protein [Nonomuraea rubra]
MRPEPGLLGRRVECEALDRLLGEVRAGRSRVLVVRGEAGVGKSALLEHLTARASGCRVVRAAGVQPEMEVAFAALYSLCAPLLDLLDGLPEPQRAALGTAFGWREGPAPDRLLLSLAVLSLLAAAAEARPLVCVVDDAQWLDHASAQVLAFVARRLSAESVACVFALRDTDETALLSGLPVMDVAGLASDDAHALLRSVVPGPLDEQVRDRLVAEARGIPLALLELVHTFTHPEPSTGYAPPAPWSPTGEFDLPATWTSGYDLATAQTGEYGLLATQAGGFELATAQTPATGYEQPATRTPAGGFTLPAIRGLTGGFGLPAEQPPAGGFTLPAIRGLTGGFGRPVAWTLAGGFGLPAARMLTGRVEDRFRRQLGRLPAATRRLLLLAAAEPVGDPALLWRAAARLGLGMAALAEAGDLIALGVRVRFRHPAVRSAIYRAALPEERRQAHQALAEATDAGADPDRRAWHRAHATAQPDEDVAAELERATSRAQARGGLAAVAAFLERAVALTPDPRRRAERALAAARAQHLAGASEPALTLLASAEAGPPDELRLAHAELLRAEIAITSHDGSSAAPLLLAAAKRFEPLDAGLSRDAYLHALSSAIRTLPDEGRGLAEVAAATRTAPPAPATPRAADLLLDALTRHLTQDAHSAAPEMRRALAAFLSEDVPGAERLGWAWAAHTVAVALWDDRSGRELADRHARLVRDTGALALLPPALSTRLVQLAFEGRLDEAASVQEEIHTLTAATGVRPGFEGPAGGALVLAAWQGRQSEAEGLADALMSEAAAYEEGATVAAVQWLRAVLHNGLGQYEQARAAAARACVHHPAPGPAAHWAPAELVEAAALSGERDLAARVLDRLAATTRASGTDWALGIEARSRALLSEGAEADGRFREAIDRLGRTRMRADLARAHLLHGEWLRREGRPDDARQPLRTAHGLFTEMGMAGFAGRAERGLPLEGEPGHGRTAGAAGRLTPHETQIVRLVRDGLTNREIAGRLLVSPKTVEYHLGKVFTKLGITSRRQLGRVS